MSIYAYIPLATLISAKFDGNILNPTKNLNLSFHGLVLEDVVEVFFFPTTWPSPCIFSLAFIFQITPLILIHSYPMCNS
jgi:hypothetical protein